MTTYYREAECDHAGWHATEEGPACLDCGGVQHYVVPVTIDYEAAIREWEYYEQDVDPYENRTYEQMIRDAVDAAVGEEEQ